MKKIGHNLKVTKSCRFLTGEKKISFVKGNYRNEKQNELLKL